MPSSPQQEDYILLAIYLRDKLAQDGYLNGSYPPDRVLRRYLDDYSSRVDLQKARDELEPILPKLRDLAVFGEMSARAVVAEQVVDRIHAAIRYLGFGP